MGLRTLVREDLARRGKTWTKRAPQATPNNKRSAILDLRIRAWNLLDSRIKPGFTKPGSMNRNKRP